MKTNIDLSKAKQVVRGPGGLRLELDASQIFPEDPGQGTPFMVVHASGASATFCCACNEGELDCGEYQLSPAQMGWLHDLAETEQVLRWEIAHTPKPRVPLFQLARTVDGGTRLDRV